jgi:nucleotide-binding universal stress UspA family protein
LETYRQQAIAKNIAVQCEAKVGNPSLAICDRASEWGADLIVLGRRGHKGISELLLGSVSNHVIHHAPCSVLIVQGLPSPEVDESVSATETEAKS